MEILAKKPVIINGERITKTLLEHSQDVFEAFRALYGEEDTPNRFALRWLDFFKIPHSEYPSFYRNTKSASLLHDIGKANAHFQKAVCGKGSQSLRHEFLGGWILSAQGIQELFESLDLDFQCIRAAVMGHHLKLDRAILETGDSQNPNITVHLSGVQEILDFWASEFSVSPLKNLGITSYVNLWDLSEDFEEIEESLQGFFKKNPPRLRLLRGIRSALILADSAGSGLAREKDRSVFVPMSQWITEAIGNATILSSEQLEEKIIRPRSQDIESKGKAFKFNSFQDKAPELSDRALLLASCGAGKTLAAWKWGTGVASRHNISRFIFLYPTRGTATEGFKDYVAWAPESDGALLHGTSEYELQDMFDNPDPRGEKDFLTNNRLFAIGLWQKRLFSATVDQFLGFMEHSYRSTCLLPLLADSAVVFDEVHSFDQKLFSALLEFLQEFDVPAFCMTASLPASRLEQLQEAGLELFPKAEDLQYLQDLQKATQAPRYRVYTTTREEALEKAIQGYRESQKILWVVNTVQRCQDLARELQEQIPEANVICYHSRFRLQDRQKRHKEVVQAFRTEKPMIAVTTQVCEMSLDLSASLLISEFAPITALIQRMGRSNRYLEFPKGAEVLLYPPEKDLPYDAEAMKKVEEFVQEISQGHAISQEKLQELLELYSPSTREMLKYLAFLSDNGFAKTTGEGLREGDGSSNPAILEKDIETYRNLRLQREPVDGLILPAPQGCIKKEYKKTSDIPPYLGITAHEYSERLGLLK